MGRDAMIPGDEPTRELMARAEAQAREDLATARASKHWAVALHYLRGYLMPQVQAQIRELMRTGSEQWPAGYHFGWGMALRNALRSAGFREETFGITNLDNIYVELVEEAVTPVCDHPEFEATVDVFRGPDPDQTDETLSRFEATVKIRCAQCGREMMFRDFNGSRVVRVRLDPAPAPLPAKE